MLIAAIAAVLAVGMLFLGQTTLPADMPGSAATASAQGCPNVEVVFARGRIEPAGTGKVGQAFISALRSKVPDQTIRHYGVDYPADVEIMQGANDMSQRIQYMAANCPNTKLVLGGYSLGAAVADVVLGVPASVFGFSNPLPQGMDKHIAAVALFGNGTRGVLGPISNVNPAYGDKVFDRCHADDPVCGFSLRNPKTWDPEAWLASWNDHLADSYVSSGIVNEAAAFAAARV